MTSGTDTHRAARPKGAPGKQRFVFAPDPGDDSPLYLQFARHLSAAIHGGVFAVNAALPSERVLAERNNVSRVTARKAIDQLVLQGFIDRRRGSGNYIAPHIEQPLSRLSGFTEELSRLGYAPRSKWLKRALAKATPEEQLSLGLSASAMVARLERTRLANDVIMSYEISTLPRRILPKPGEVESSLYEYLSRSGKAPRRAVQHIRAVNANAHLAQRLDVPVGQALLFITRIGYLDDGPPIELTHSYCHSDHYDFVAEMRRG
jgi:GntR family transcriptional regulator